MPSSTSQPSRYQQHCLALAPSAPLCICVSSNSLYLTFLLLCGARSAPDPRAHQPPRRPPAGPRGSDNRQAAGGARGSPGPQDEWGQDAQPLAGSPDDAITFPASVSPDPGSHTASALQTQRNADLLFVHPLETFS